MSGKIGPLAFLLLTMFAGALMPLQMGANATISQYVRVPLEGTMVNFLGGMLVLYVLLAACGYFVPPNPLTVPAAPWWSWFGGAIGVLMVTISIAARHSLGATTFFAAIVAGQMVSSILLDHYGWMGFPERSISVPRMCGAALVLVGVFLTSYGSKAN